MSAALRFGYGTNGFADHRLDDALAVLADLGYDGVALTLDHQHLDPFGAELAQRTVAVAGRLAELGLAVVVETGARYLLDPWQKHQPTLLSVPDGAARRVELLRRAVRVAADLGAGVVSCWSGTAPPSLPEPEAWRRLVAGCGQVLPVAEQCRVRLGFEPEPGMFVATLAGYAELAARLGHPDRFGLTLDIGHCRVREPDPVPECVRAAAGERLVHVQIDDARQGVHEHLPLGSGEIEFPPVLAALAEAGYQGMVSVELPRHSHAAVALARQSLAFLQAAAPAPVGVR